MNAAIADNKNQPHGANGLNNFSHNQKRETRENFNKNGGGAATHKRMSSQNADHLNRVVKLTNQKFLSRSPDIHQVNGAGAHSEKPVQRRSKSGVDGVFAHPNNLNRVQNFAANNNEGKYNQL